MVEKILIIRGGAIGDFVLTLPSIRLLREARPDAKLQILGRRPIVQLADGRYYAEKTSDLDASSLVSFFTAANPLNSRWCEYFSGFSQAISYLYDPENIFAQNLMRAGIDSVIRGPHKIAPGIHASYQLARPLESWGLFLKDTAASLFPSETDKAISYNLLTTQGIRSDTPFVVCHPGSGGSSKNWPIDYWARFSKWMLQAFPKVRLLYVGSEADTRAIQYLSHELHSSRVVFMENVPLPTLAALLSLAQVFIGHDTGISHIAAATGAPCLLLYGPTDPNTWAPTNPSVLVLTSPTPLMKDLPTDAVFAAFESFFQTHAGNRNRFGR